MNGFVALSAHIATAYLHLLLAWRFYPQRRNDFFVYVFWMLMVVSCVLHLIYAYAFFIVASELEFFLKETFLAGYWLLAFFPAFLVVLFLGELTELPKNNNALARLLSHVSKDARRLFVVAMLISLMTVFWSLVDVLPFSEWYAELGNLYALSYLLIFSVLWVLMLFVGLRPAKTDYNFITPLFRSFVVLLVLMSLLSYCIDVGDFWSFIPIFSTIGLSLCFCWYRFRTQFMDVILNQFVRIIMVISIVIFLSILVEWMNHSAVAIRIKMTILLAFIVVAGLLYQWLAKKMEAFWRPPISELTHIHSELPRILSKCTNATEAIDETETFLQGLFLSDVSINRPLPGSVQSLTLSNKPEVNVNLGYLRRWMPWFSEALNWIRIAALYLQGHLKVIQTLKQEHEQTLKTEALTSLAAKAELNAMRSQIRPHFLFNILNSIHDFVTTDPKQAEKTIEMLADLMRGILQMSDKDEVKLQQELTMVERYLEIEKIRYGEQFRYEINVNRKYHMVNVPPFSIQPLVENAIKHAVDSQLDPVTIKVEVAERNKVLQIDVVDDGPGLQVNQNSLSEKHLGLALQNIESRLKKLYDGEGHFSLCNGAKKGAIASIVVPIHEK